MIQLKNIDELRLMKQSARLVSQTLGMLAKEIKPGVTTLYLDKLAYDFIKDHGAEPAFLGYGGFPASLCISPNEQVVHGIPNSEPIKERTILSVDCGVFWNGFTCFIVEELFSRHIHICCIFPIKTIFTISYFINVPCLNYRYSIF